MLAKFERNTSVLRAPLSLPGTVEMFLDPFSLILSLIGCAVYFGDTVDARYIVLSLVVFSLSFPGSSLLSMRPRRVVRQSVINWLLIAFILMFFGYASQYIENFPREVVLAWLFAAPATQLTAHFAARAYLRRNAAQEENQTRVIIVGCNDIGLTNFVFLAATILDAFRHNREDEVLKPAAPVLQSLFQQAGERGFLAASRPELANTGLHRDRLEGHMTGPRTTT